MEPNIASLAAMIADPSRAKMLTALLGGKALTATELALEADITAQTASNHLSKLLEKELLVVRKQGRHKYFQLAGTHIARLLENLMVLSHNIKSIKTGPSDNNLKVSRVCYDHMAGEIAVALYDALLRQGFIVDNIDHCTLSPAGKRFFISLGATLSTITNKTRPLCRPCLDWSERRSHLAGTLGQWVLNDALQKGWATRDLVTRAIHFSSHGKRAFFKCYAIT
jgi:DNA-binding transcriptional ArsR family regulator